MDTKTFAETQCLIQEPRNLFFRSTETIRKTIVCFQEQQKQTFDELEFQKLKDPFQDLNKRMSLY